MTKRDHGISEWHTRYSKKHGSYRSDLLRNPGVLFQVLAYETSIINALNSINISPELSKVLDVGCGVGASTAIFIRAEFEPKNIVGIDILENRVQAAIKKYPSMQFCPADASQMPFEDGFFNLVCESTMFVQITDDDLALKIAKEMIRVTKSGGYLMLADWRYNKPMHPEYKGLSKKRLTNLFDLDHSCQLIETFNGSLIPPVGRFLSSRVRGLYFLSQALLPFLVGQVVYILRKP